jgi:glycosyltransferase involved in cell wall biosynthesis
MSPASPPKRLESEIEYLFVLPGVRLFPSGNYKVVYEIARFLSSEQKSVGIVFLRNPLSYAKTRVQMPRRTPSQRLGGWIASLASTKTGFMVVVPLLRRTKGIHYEDSFEGVKIFFSLKELSGVTIRKAFAIEWSTIFGVMSLPVTDQRYFFVQGEGHKREFAGDFASIAELVHSSELRKIVVNSKEEAEFLDEGPLRIHLGIKIEDYPLIIPAEERDGKTLVMPLAKGKAKGAENGLRAAGLLVRALPAIRILSFGNYPRRGIPSYIDHRGMITRHQDLIDLYNEASVLVIPSLSEGFGLPGLEGLCTGTAVVSTDNGGAREYLQDGKNGLLVPPNSPEAIKDAVLKLLTDRELRLEIVKKGAQTAREFTLERMCQEFMAAVG